MCAPKSLSSEASQESKLWSWRAVTQEWMVPKGINLQREFLFHLTEDLLRRGEILEKQLPVVNAPLRLQENDSLWPTTVVGIRSVRNLPGDNVPGFLSSFLPLCLPSFLPSFFSFLLSFLPSFLRSFIHNTVFGCVLRAQLGIKQKTPCLPTWHAPVCQK